MPAEYRKVALVTGGATGIGLGIVERFASAGMAVAILDLNASRAVEEAERVDAAGTVIGIGGDVSREEDVRTAVARIVEIFGAIDVLINNAGIELYGTVDTMPVESWERQIDVNLKGAFLCSKHVIPHMRQRGGVILNVSSVHAAVSYPASAAYDASKAALAGLTRAMAVDHGREGIRVNAICPGYIDTPLMTEWLRNSPNPDETLREVIRSHPIGRIGTPRDVAEACLFLASDAAAFITGAHLTVDGGMTALGR